MSRIDGITADGSIIELKIPEITDVAKCYLQHQMAKCSGCDEVTSDVSAREQFNEQIMCDVCWSESCHNAMNSANGDTMIDSKAFNEIKQTNNRRGR